MRRLTLLTAASTQTLSVQEVIDQVLSHLVESLGATHGIVRLKEGEGNSAQLVGAGIRRVSTSRSWHATPNSLRWSLGRSR